MDNIDTIFYEVLNMNFDDIKQSSYFPNIYNRWNSLNFLDIVDSEKRKNLACCYEQMASFLLLNPNDEKINFIANKFNISSEDLKNIIFHIIQKVYGVMELSDYDYLEILDAFENIDAKNIINNINNESDKEAAYALISTEISKYINLKR